MLRGSKLDERKFALAFCAIRDCRTKGEGWAQDLICQRNCPPCKSPRCSSQIKSWAWYIFAPTYTVAATCTGTQDSAKFHRACDEAAAVAERSLANYYAVFFFLTEHYYADAPKQHKQSLQKKDQRDMEIGSREAQPAVQSINTRRSRTMRRQQKNWAKSQGFFFHLILQTLLLTSLQSYVPLAEVPETFTIDD